MSMQMMAPADGLRNSITVNGRSYTCALGAVITVPDQDGLIMSANGWIAASSGGSGATTARPSAPNRGDEFHDTTLGILIRFDGKVWRNPHTAAAV